MKEWLQTRTQCLRFRRLPSLLLTIALATILAFTWTVLTSSAGEGATVRPDATAAPAPRDDSNDGCIECHADSSETISFPSGESASLSIDPVGYAQSVHGDWLDCVDCHQANRRYPHPLPEVGTLREYARGQYELCKRCHLENYTRTMDSIHGQAMAEGKPDAPICTDCHDAHTMKPVHESRTQTPKACSDCHDDVYEEYASSVHGAALWEENEDVPDCVTCHGVHNIGAAKTSSFRQASVGLCASCHANKEKMKRYDISPDVLKTYLEDFHGKTVGFYQRQTSEIWPDVAVCTDCHGVHDIKPVDDPGSSVIKANLLEACQKCHENAGEKFPAAWLSHYQPSLDKAPLVFLVRRYYQFLIPLMVVGLALNVALDLWRLARNR